MRQIKNNIQFLFSSSYFVCSSANEEDTLGDIAVMGKKLANEVIDTIRDICGNNMNSK